MKLPRHGIRRMSKTADSWRQFNSPSGRPPSPVLQANKRLWGLGGRLFLAVSSYLFYLYLFRGPYRFVQFPLREASLRYLQASIPMYNPVDAADEYLHGLVSPSDRPERRKLDITVRQISEQETVVTVIDRFCKDDSIDVTCDRLTMRRQNGRWIPVQHQAAWQDLRRIGWTTLPSS